MALGKKRNVPHQDQTDSKAAKIRKALNATESQVRKRRARLIALDTHEWFSESFKIDVQGQNERASFTVPVGVARTRSPFFAHALTSKPIDAAPRYHGEPITAEPHLFKLFLFWLYRGSFDYREEYVHHIMAGSPALLGADDKPNIYAPLVRLWLLAEVLKVPALANQTVDKMFELADAGTLPSKGVIKVVYQAHQRCEVLRELMVQLCACYCDPEQRFTHVHDDFEKSLMLRLQVMVSSNKRRDSFKKKTGQFYLPGLPPTAWPPRAPKREDIVDLVSDTEHELFVPDGEPPPALDPEASSKHVRISITYEQPPTRKGPARLAPLNPTRSPTSIEMPESAKTPTAVRSTHVQPAESDVDAANRGSELSRLRSLLEARRRERYNAKTFQAKKRLNWKINDLVEAIERLEKA